MSGENGKSWNIEIIPLWLMKPCCMLAPSTTASSPDCRPPLIRASNALAWPPLETPGMRSTKAAAARGPLVSSMGNWASVSGAMPSSWAPLS